MAEVEFYFYYGCPWTYMACGRLLEAAMRTSARIRWKPILVQRVREAVTPGAAAHGQPLDPARARYQRKDLADWARFCGVSIRHPGPFPLPALQVLRGAVAALDAGGILPYSEAVFRAGFEDGLDLDAPGTVAAAAAAAGLDPGRIAAQAARPASLAALEANSDELVARGGFGSPTFFVGDDMYFGNDRMPLVELALTRAADRPLVIPGAHGQL